MKSSVTNILAGGALLAASLSCFFNLRAKPACAEFGKPAVTAGTPCHNDNRIFGLSLGLIYGWGAAMTCLTVGLGDALDDRRRKKPGPART